MGGGSVVGNWAPKRHLASARGGDCLANGKGYGGTWHLAAIDDLVLLMKLNEQISLGTASGVVCEIRGHTGALYYVSISAVKQYPFGRQWPDPVLCRASRAVTAMAPGGSGSHNGGRELLPFVEKHLTKSSERNPTMKQYTGDTEGPQML